MNRHSSCCWRIVTQRGSCRHGCVSSSTSTALDAHSSATRIAFIEHVLCDPGDRASAVRAVRCRALVPASRLSRSTTTAGCSIPELVFGAIKKSGKTTLAAIIMLMMVLLFGGRFAEGFCVANDFEQAQCRVFAIVKRIIEASPLLRAIAKLTADRVTFPALDANIIAIASDAACAAGANPVITCFDELWGYTSERSRRLWDELVPVPTRKISCRLTVSYAGFTGESAAAGGDLQARHGAAGGRALAARRRRLLMAWHREPIAPWQNGSVAHGDAPHPAPQRLRAHDHQRIRFCRKPVRGHGGVGRVRAAVAHAHPGTDPDLRRCRCQREA